MIIGALFTDEPRDQLDFVPNLIINLSGILTLLCLLFIAIFVVTHLYPIKETRHKLASEFRRILGNGLYLLIWLVPLTATFLSLTMSEYLGFVPCKLCWYQRIFMYSLAVLMLIYYFHRKKIIRIIGYFLAVIGGTISTYHVVIEKYPHLESTACDPSVPCAAPWFYVFEVFTLASMALVAFITVIAMLYMSSKNEK